MKRILFTLLLLIASVSLLLGESEITFSGGKSRLNLTEGEKEVVLSEGATVTSDTLLIKSDEITLSGENWRYIECSGYTVISDSERGIEIRTRSLWYDRESERLLINTWFEIDDTKEEVSAMGNSLLYDMKGEMLELSKNITVLRITDDGLMRGEAESVIYDRNNEIITLRGNATVDWDGDIYSAQSISVDTKTNDIILDGKIQGSING